MSGTKEGSRASRCSFCGKEEARSNLVVAGYGRAFVCYPCIRVLGETVGIESEEVSDRESSPVRSVPRDICASLDKYVIGQQKAKKTLSVAVYNHFKRIDMDPYGYDVELQKSNILLIGPTGCGKTLLAETLAKTLEVPFVVCDATSLTESGYVGEDVENILLRLIQAADWDLAKAEQGIIYIDELDKIARKEGVNRSITRDVSGEGVQQELLKIIEGCVANVPPQGGRKHPHQEFLQINTKDILFICGGAFDGLEEIVSKRLSYGNAKIGFLGGTRSEGSSDDNMLSQVSPEDLLAFGFIPEMIGRLPVVTSLEPLDKEGLIRVLTEPKNAMVKQYQQLFEIDGVDLEFTSEALAAAADAAIKHYTGARCLRYVVEEVLLEVMYELPSRSDIARCVVDADSINEGCSPTLITNSGESFRICEDAFQRSA